MNASIVTAYLIDSLKVIKGRKAYQKLIYLTKAVGVPLDGSYRMYYYGPYSDEIAKELDYSLSRGILRDQSDSYYFISGNEAKSIVEENQELINKYKGKLDKVINSFGKFEPMQLEIIATTHFIYNNLKHLYNITDKSVILDEVKKAKFPKFNEEQIEEAYNILVKEGLIAWATGDDSPWLTLNLIHKNNKMKDFGALSRIYIKYKW